jgi:hypothetical protein
MNAKQGIPAGLRVCALLADYSERRSKHGQVMSKKRPTPTDQQHLELRQLNGFWLLRKISETQYIQQKIASKQTTRYNKPVLVLVDSELMNIVWYAESPKSKGIPIQIYRGKVVTRPLSEPTEVRANCELKGDKMHWKFVVNRDENNYSQYHYLFQKERE